MTSLCLVNRNVFNFALKVSTLLMTRRSVGMEFHSLGAKYRKALLPNSKEGKNVFTSRSRVELSLMWRRDVKGRGAISFRHLKVVRSTLKTILCLMFSQWKEMQCSRTESRFLSLKMTQTAAFCIFWSLANDALWSPKKRRLHMSRREVMKALTNISVSFWGLGDILPNTLQFTNITVRWWGDGRWCLSSELVNVPFILRLEERKEFEPKTIISVLVSLRPSYRGVDTVLWLDPHVTC